MREPQEVIVGAVTGSVRAPRALLLGRYDTDGRLHYTGRTMTLPQAAARGVAVLLAPSRGEHPWTGWTFSAGWGSGEVLDVTLVRPELRLAMPMRQAPRLAPWGPARKLGPTPLRTAKPSP